MVDIGPVNIAGAIKARRVRVVWQDDTLYVVKSAKIINKYENVPQPVEEQGVWYTTYNEQEVNWTRKGCPSCGYSLGSIKLDKILS